jgi:hypothetical protein
MLKFRLENEILLNFEKKNIVIIYYYQHYKIIQSISFYMAIFAKTFKRVKNFCSFLKLDYTINIYQKNLEKMYIMKINIWKKQIIF